MAEIFHLRCRYCGDAMPKSREPYCDPCNLYLCYRAMPLLLGLLMTGELQSALSKRNAAEDDPYPTYRYRHTRYILD